MIQFAGERTFPLPPDGLFAKLRDARFLVECVPDSQVLGTPTETEGQCRVRPGFSFVRGSMDVTLSLKEATPPGTLRWHLTSKGIGSSSVVETVLHLKAAASGTQVEWTAEVRELGGLLKIVPSGLIRGAAQKVIEDLWQGVTAKLGTPAP